MSSILIIDDDAMLSKTLANLIKNAGHEARYVLTLKEGMKLACTEPFDVVMMDVHMPDGNGLKAVSQIRDTASKPEVIVITAAGDADGAELAIRSGASGYIEKSPSLKDLLSPLFLALEYRRERITAQPPVVRRDKIIGVSREIHACLDLVAHASSCDANILITGETGTGKELFARAIHENSCRADRCFVVVDCAALPKDLVESLLFGHRKGAFTGANWDQPGLLAHADRGTLFLDEVGELPLDLQKRFLRVLQERCFRPVGAREEIGSNFRVIAATNRNLDGMAEAGAFRKDLLFRIRALSMELPPLRRRSEDIVELVRYHADRLSALYAMEPKSISPGFLDAMRSYSWPGNVRELVNVVEGALALAGRSSTLFCEHLPLHMRIHIARGGIRKERGNQTGPSSGLVGDGALPSWRDFRETVERQYLNRLIIESMNDVQEATRISGISRSRLYELLNKHGLALTKDPPQEEKEAHVLAGTQRGLSSW